MVGVSLRGCGHARMGHGCTKVSWQLWVQALMSCLQMLGQFIARAVADHALPLDFLERYKGRVDCEHAR